jgi:hypothetical protein
MLFYPGNHTMISLNERRPFVISIYPSPAWPYWALRVVFVVVICVGVAWLIYLRLTSLRRLSDAGHDLLVMDMLPLATALAEPHAGAAE